VCSGAFLLAEAGQLDRRRATTHWALCEALQRRHPAVRVERDPIFVRDGHVYTSAGITAGMDLALELVEEDFGRELALTVARWLVMFLRRPGGQSQFSVQLSTQLPERDGVREVQGWIAHRPRPVPPPLPGRPTRPRHGLVMPGPTEAQPRAEARA
jgi:transcriptional regulator GlxA family with amidase domain